MKFLGRQLWKLEELKRSRSVRRNTFHHDTHGKKNRTDLKDNLTNKDKKCLDMQI